MKSTIVRLERAGLAALALVFAGACVSAGDELRQGQEQKASVFTNPPGQEATARCPGSSTPSAACSTWRKRSGLNGLCSQ